MMKRFSMKSPALLLLVGVILFTFALPAPGYAARKDCSLETDTGKRTKCKTENLNDAFDGLVTTVLSDDTGAFSEKQKKQLSNMKKRSKNEIGRMEPEDLKQLSKKRKVDCYIQEILGDVTDQNDSNGNGECDGDEECIGDEDGICDANERNKGGCAEVLNDGIGDDDGICEFKGKYDEACIEICDPDLILAEDDERNINRGKAQEMEQALVDATGIVDETNTTVTKIIQSRRTAAATFLNCDKNTMAPCAYLECIIEKGRYSSSDTIEDLVIATAALQTVADVCRTVADQTIPIPFFGGSIDSRIVCVPLGLAANGTGLVAGTFEVIDDTETADRIDATAECAQDTGDQVEQVDRMVQDILGLLLQPQGQRPGFQETQ